MTARPSGSRSQRAATRPPERIRDARLAPLAAERALERSRSPLATVRDRQLGRVRSAREAARQRGRRGGGGEDALEASGAQQRPHGRPRGQLLDHLAHALDRVLRRLLLVVLHAPEHRDGDALARERDQPEPDAAGHLDRLEREPVGEAGRVRHAVVAERKGHRRLHEADVPGPERDDRRDVHQDEHEAGRGERRVDAERLHRRVHGEELQQPAEALEDDRAGERDRRLQHGETLAGHAEEMPRRADALAHRRRW